MWINSTVNAADSNLLGWRLAECAIKFNELTGQVGESSKPAQACINVTQAQIDILNTRNKAAKIKACLSYKIRLDELLKAKRESGITWIGDFVCSEDCSGHIAGAKWSLKNDAKSRSDCPQTNGIPFTEGCWAHVKDTQRISFEHEHCGGHPTADSSIP